MFKKHEKVIYHYHTDNGIEIVRATIMDPGSTKSSIMIFDSTFDGGKPTFKTVDNDSLINEETYNRNKKINEILK